ncbi:MAG: hypothetical protein K0Q59_5455, partial [Paenibacillus sp.]|nr:hypothetical protein [Paenibacillus sp.]
MKISSVTVRRRLFIALIGSV